MKLATLCYIKRNNQTLMLHRIKKENDMHQGKWNGLGGKFEPGETPEACAVREIYEESGLRVNDPELRGILTFPAFNDDEDWYAFVFVVRDFSGELIDRVEELEPGASGTVDIGFDEPGVYQFICDVDDHLSRGQQATFRVNEPASE